MFLSLYPFPFLFLKSIKKRKCPGWLPLYLGQGRKGLACSAPRSLHALVHAEPSSAVWPWLTVWHWVLFGKLFDQQLFQVRLLPAKPASATMRPHNGARTGQRGQWRHDSCVTQTPLVFMHASPAPHPLPSTFFPRQRCICLLVPTEPKASPRRMQRGRVKTFPFRSWGFSPPRSHLRRQGPGTRRPYLSRCPASWR